MPSSLMARLKATQQQQQQQQGTSASDNGHGSGGGSGRSNVVTPPPPTTSSLSSRAGSSTLGAATASSSLGGRLPSKHITIDGGGGYSSSINDRGGYVPQFKRNPLNVTATASAAVASVPSTTEATVVGSSSAPTTNNDATKTMTTSIADLTTTTTTANGNEINEVPSATSATITQPTASPTPPKTLMQQLLPSHHSNSQGLQSLQQLPPQPYFMCSQSEANDRQQHLELSPFECLPSSTSNRSGAILSTSRNNDSVSPLRSPAPQSGQAKASRNRPRYHPQCVIKKYRRSAAGGGTLSEESAKDVRTIEQLEGTVDYLVGYIFAHQQPPPLTGGTTLAGDGGEDDAGGDDNCDPNEISIWGDDTPVKTKPHQHHAHHEEQQQQQHDPFSLSDTVAFVDDRLRAVQKDLVTLLGNLDDSPNHTTSTSPSSTCATSNSVAAKRQRLKRQRTLQTAREMQAKMVRYNILSSYLLSQVSVEKYQVKFGARALRTALTSFLNLSALLREDCRVDDGVNKQQQQQQQQTQTFQQKKDNEAQDEIMAYVALLHSSAVLRSEESALPHPPGGGEFTSSFMEDGGGGWGALLSSFCKHAFDGSDKTITIKPNATNNNGSLAGVVEGYPRWKWALELACAAQDGNYQRYFNLLETGPIATTFTSTTTTSSALGAEGADAQQLAAQNNARFLILARMCTSHSLNLIRLGQLRRYNHAFRKGEKVPVPNLTRLLRFANDKEAIGFCRDAGLPVEEEGDKLFVAMKTAPIGVKGDEAIRRMCNPGRSNDLFVFGSRFELMGDGGSDDNDDAVESLAERLVQQCDIQDDVDDWEDRDGNDNDNKYDPLVESRSDNVRIASVEKARNDEDRVLIPPGNVLRSLILNDR